MTFNKNCILKNMKVLSNHSLWLQSLYYKTNEFHHIKIIGNFEISYRIRTLQCIIQVVCLIIDNMIASNGLEWVIKEMYCQ